jgi:hypothetical protein
MAENIQTLRGCRKKEPSYTVGAMYICATTMENSMEAPPKLKLELPYHPEILLLSKYQSGYNKDTCTSLFIAALLTVVILSKLPRCTVTDEWIKKMCNLCIMEFY